MTLACEDNYSKLVGVVTVADVDDEDRVGNSALLILMMRIMLAQCVADLVAEIWS